jgi:hypothetical protein
MTKAGKTVFSFGSVSLCIFRQLGWLIGLVMLLNAMLVSAATWSVIGSLQKVRSDHTATLLQNG